MGQYQRVKMVFKEKVSAGYNSHHLMNPTPQMFEFLSYRRFKVTSLENHTGKKE